MIFLVCGESPSGVSSSTRLQEANKTATRTKRAGFIMLRVAVTGDRVGKEKQVTSNILPVGRGQYPITRRWISKLIGA